MTFFAFSFIILACISREREQDTRTHFFFVQINNALFARARRSKFSNSAVPNAKMLDYDILSDPPNKERKAPRSRREIARAPREARTVNKYGKMRLIVSAFRSVFHY